MQQVTSIQELRNAVNKNGEMVIALNNNEIVIMRMEEYREKVFEDEIEKKLLKAEEQIKEGKTIKASEVFKELEEQYGIWKRNIWNRIYRRL